MGNAGARGRSIRSWGLGPVVACALALTSVACGAHSVAPPQAPLAAASMNGPVALQVADETKTVTVDYAFDRDSATRDFDKTFDDGFEKKGLKVDQSLTAHAHFDVKDAKSPAPSPT